MITVLKPFIELPYGTKFRYQGSEEVWVRTQHNVIAGWSPSLIQSGHQSLCAFCLSEDDKEAMQTLVEVVGDQPAEQHQGEPVALPGRKPERVTDNYSAGWNACLHEIAKLGPLFTRPAQGEPVAWRGINELGEIVTEWIDGSPPDRMVDLCGNPASFAKIELAYTHADPGEVERVKAELVESDHAFVRMASEAEKLRAQLAERDTLLRDCRWRIVNKDTSTADYQRLDKPVVERIDALSASAEPSAPECKYCGDTGKIMVGRSGDASDGNAPIMEPCEDCDRGAPVERDERAEFEKAIAQKWPGIRMLRIYRPGAPANGEYELPGLEGAWQGWKARAALERKPLLPISGTASSCQRSLSKNSISRTPGRDSSRSCTDGMCTATASTCTSCKPAMPNQLTRRPAI